MHIFAHVYMCVCVSHMYTYTNNFSYIHTCMRTYIHIYQTYIHTYLLSYSNTIIHTYIHAYIHYTNMHTHTCMYTRTGN